MATYFGEVLSVSSRAVDDDEDEDESPQPLPEPFTYWADNVKNDPKVKVPCSTLLIAFGNEATAFVDIYFTKQLEFEKVGGIFTSGEPGDGILFSKVRAAGKSCFIYRDVSDPTVLLCLCKRDVLPEESYNWSKMIVEEIDLSQAVITILTACGTGSYCSDVPAYQLETPFLRCLKSDKYDGHPASLTLEQPNLLTGFPAMSNETNREAAIGAYRTADS